MFQKANANMLQVVNLEGGVTDCTPSICSGYYEQQGQVSCEWDGNYWTCERVCRRDAECGSSLSLIYDSGLQSQTLNNQYSGSLSSTSTSTSDTDYCYKIMSLNNRQYVSSWGWFDADSTYTAAGIYGPTGDTNEGCHNEISDGQNIYPGSTTVCLAPDTPDSWGGISGCTTARVGSGYGSGYYSKISFLSYNDVGCGGGSDDINSQTLYTQFKVYETLFTPEDYDYLYCDVPYTNNIDIDSTIYGNTDADCYVEVQGSESYPDEIKVKWYVNGDYVSSEICDSNCDDHTGTIWSNTFSLDNSYYSKGDEVYCIGRGYGEDGGNGAYVSSSTTTVSNLVPTWSSISLDKSIAKQGDNIKVTASGEADSDTDVLAMYCCNGDSCTPSTSNHDFCYVTGNSPPYNLYCTGQGVSGNGTKTIRCRIYDGGSYSDIKSSTYTADNTAPNVNITSPLNQTYNVSLINFNVTLNENGKCMYSLNNGITNISMSSTDNKNFSAINSSMNNGNYVVKFYCNDSVGNMNNTKDVSFTISYSGDIIPPSIAFVSPTPSNNLNQFDNSIFVNVTASDIGRGNNNISTFIDFDSSLLSWWRMDDTNGSANSVLDYLGRSNGTAQRNAVQTSVGKLGKGFSFNGSGDYINCGNNTAFNANNITLSAWIYSNKITSQQSILSRFPVGGGAGQFNFYIISSKLSFDIPWVKGNVIKGTTTLNSDQWYYVAYTRLGNVHTLYLNSIQENQTTDSAAFVMNGNVWIGAAQNPAAYFNGTIDDVMIFNRSLSADEIKGLYANQTSKYLARNFTNLAIGSHTFKAYTQDMAGNVNWTEKRTVSII